ncbi:MAG: D-alanyl-D-alanine carboxypeptidase/D-alanyl-D-alanine-endopeptidase [Bacteroidota bacterium]
MLRLILLLLFCYPLLHFSQNSFIQSAINTLNRDPDMRSAEWSFTVLDLSSGEMIASHNPHKSLSTASSMKVITTATALAILGPGYRYETFIEYDGDLDGEILEGNLYLRGSGDPSLGSDRFGEDLSMDKLLNRWALKIKDAGIREIRGQIIGDAQIFSTQITPDEWAWEDIGNYYGAGVSGLNLFENLYYLDLKPGASVGSATKVIRTRPAMNIRFQNELRTAGSRTGDNAYIFGAPYTRIRYIRGSIPAGRPVFTIKGSIPDPTQFAAERLKMALEKCGIVVEGGATSVRYEKLQGNYQNRRRSSLMSHQSPPLSEIVFHTNMKSVNLFAEALARTIAVDLGKFGGNEEAVESIMKYWGGKGIDTRGMNMRDGSGLSASNAVSTYQMASILRYASRQAYFSTFEKSLPLAGKSGSLRGMLKGTVAEGRLRAKSGYIAGVRSYTGYVTTQSGKKWAFSMISNNYSCGAGAMRRKLEKLMVAMASQ